MGKSVQGWERNRRCNFLPGYHFLGSLILNCPVPGRAMTPKWLLLHPVSTTAAAGVFAGNGDTFVKAWHSQQDYLSLSQPFGQRRLEKLYVRLPSPTQGIGPSNGGHCWSHPCPRGDPPFLPLLGKGMSICFMKLLSFLLLPFSYLKQYNTVSLQDSSTSLQF